MLFAALRNTVILSLEKVKQTFFLAEDKTLESLPEPYIPSAQEIVGMPEKLREKASKALHGSDANPSQLGDPVSLKAEQSGNVPKPDEEGAQSSSSLPSNSAQQRGTSNKSGGHHNTLREKATKHLHGPDANPTQLGDPISLKAEQSDHVPKPEEQGAQRKTRDSKL
jgi:hypothetical protein